MIAEMSVEELELSIRSHNVLRRANIATVGELLALLEKNLDDFSSLRHNGSKCIREILYKVKCLGYDVAGLIKRHIQQVDVENKLYWADVLASVYKKPIISFSDDNKIKHIENLDGLTMEICSLLRTVETDLPELLEMESGELWLLLDNRSIGLLLRVLDEYGLRMKDCSLELYPDIEKYISENYVVETCDLELSTRTKNCLIKNSICTLAELLKYSRNDLLEQKILGTTALDDLICFLFENRVHLAGDAFYRCSRCNSYFASVENSNKKHFCSDCCEKIKHINRIKDIQVTIESPDYSSYTDGTKGFSLFATVHNQTSRLMEISLYSFMAFYDGRQWSPSGNYSGYRFNTEHIMPKSSKTIGKVWSSLCWEDKEMQDGDYVEIILETKEKRYAFKFVVLNNTFEIDDYYVY